MATNVSYTCDKCKDTVQAKRLTRYEGHPITGIPTFVPGFDLCDRCRAEVIRFINKDK